MPTKLRVRVGERWYAVEVGDPDANPVRVIVDGEPVEVSLEPLASADGAASPEQTTPTEDRRPPSPKPQAPSPVKVFKSPMPGVILSVAVKVGDEVVTGDEVCVLEAMKMQQSLRAEWSGTIKAIHVDPGQQVLEGDPIAELR